jgi:F-type H+-transporting ATPase subunit c
MIAYMLYYGATVLVMFLGAIGTGIGQGIASADALDAMSRQSLGRQHVFRAMMIGLALVESGAIFALVVSLILLMGHTGVVTTEIAISYVGSACAVGLSAAVVGIASSMAVSAACKAMSRQPFAHQKTMTLMLLSQSIIEAPVIFAFLVSLLIKASVYEGMSLAEGIALLCAGLVAAFGSVGPAIGQAIFSQKSCQAVGINDASYKSIVPYSLVSQAVIETPVIFALLLAFLFIYLPLGESFGIVGIASYVAATISLGLGSFGTGIANGFVASKGSEQIAKNPSLYPLILKTTLFSLAIIEASVIYSFIIALILVSVASTSL